jgi:HlyD family secretion protein
MLLDFHSPTAALTVVPVLHGARGTIWTISSLVAACVAAAALIPIDKVVTAQGKVVAQAASSVVQPLETAIVRSIEVREGQTVHKGDLLARLDPTIAVADSRALEAQVASLSAEVDRLQAEASGNQYHPRDISSATVLQRAIFLQHEAERGFKNENYAQKIGSLQSQIHRAETDRDAYAERLRVAEDVERKRMELERLQIGSQLNRLSATDNRLEVRRDLSNAVGQVVQATRDLQAMQAERDGYNQQWRSQANQELTEQGRKLSDARENLNKAVLRRQLMELRAQQDGVVLNVAKVSPGSVLQSGEQVLTLVPVDTPLEVEADVAGTDAGFVHPGDTVTVKFDTFPYTQYGAAEGVVQVVSADSFTSNPDDKQRGVQQHNQAGGGPAYYRGRITLDQIKLHDTPPGFHVVPGMPVTADIKVGKRTVVDYLLSRVLSVALSGMREP